MLIRVANCYGHEQDRFQEFLVCLHHFEQPLLLLDVFVLLLLLQSIKRFLLPVTFQSNQRST